MGDIRERFGFKKIELNIDERRVLIGQLKESDRKRINLFSFITLVAGIIYFILDFFVFNDKNQKGYLFFDSSLVIISLFIVLNFSFFQNKKTLFFKKYRDLFYTLYPITILLWGTGIVMFDPGSSLNIISFFLPFFIVVFAGFTSLKMLLLHYLIVLVEYLILAYILGVPFFSDVLALIFITMVYCLPFYYLFRHNKYQLHMALIKHDKLNHSLENEVNKRIRELQYLNINLKSEIGQRKIVEQKLRDTLKRAESSDQLKSEFLANISHEIRTPLNAIIGFTEMITEDGVPAEKKKMFFELIGANTMYLLSSIDDIFDASLVKTGQIIPINKSFNVEHFLANLFYEITSIRIKYQRNGLELKTRKIDDPSLKITTDEYYLKKAMIRLIDNAFKFTQKGTIEVGARKKPGGIEFFVIDTGIGIKETDRDKIFEPFVQGDGSFSRGYGGSGLGLTIVKGIVDSLGCKLEYFSKENEGSSFSILLLHNINRL